MHSETGLPSQSLQELRRYNSRQVDRYLTDFVHPLGMERKDMVSAAGLVPLIETDEDFDFANIVMGQGNISQLPQNLSCPQALQRSIVEMFQYSQEFDQEASNVIVTSNHCDFEILPESRKFGYYDSVAQTYLSGPGIYIPKRQIKCYMHSHPPGIQLFQDVRGQGHNPEQIKLLMEAVSLSDTLNLLIDSGSLAYEAMNSMLLVGNTVATLVARTPQTEAWVKGDDWKTIENLYTALENIFTVDVSLPIVQQNINNLSKLSRQFNLAVYSLGLGDGNIAENWQLIQPHI